MVDEPADGPDQPARAEDLYEFDGAGDPDDPGPGRGSGLPPRVEAWRRRTVTGAMLTGIARGLGQVFEPERERAAIVSEMPGAPPPPPGPVEAVIDPEDPEASRLVVRRWMLEEEPEGSAGEGGAEEAAAEPGGADRPEP